MNKQDPFDIIVEQIASLINLAREKSAEKFSDTPLSPDLEKRLNFIEDYVHKMGEIANEDIRDKSISNRDLARKIISERSLLPKKDKRAVEQTLSLTQDTLSLKYALTMAELRLREPEKDVLRSKVEGVSSGKKRQAKFKKTQGNKTWKKI